MTGSDQPHYSALVDTRRSPHARLYAAGLRDVNWTGGLLGDRVEACRRVMVPTMRRLMTESERIRYLGNLMVASGKQEGRYRGPKWNDGDFYKWIEASIASGCVDELDDIIEAVAAAQAPDGYAHSPVTIDQRAGGSAQRFADPMHFEMYNMGHLITAAVMHHRLTGKRSLLDLGILAADFLDRVFASPTPAVARHGICPAHLMALVELYREVGERRYLDLACRLLAMRDLVEKGDDDNQDRIPLREQREAIGHAVRATYLYAGVADIIAETGDSELRAALDSVWNDMVTRKLAITGGCGALYDGASPDGVEDQASITRIHQAFGRPYQLPHTTAHNETCAAIGSLMWNWRMFLLTGEARFADLVEETFYNSVLAGISLDGTAFFYTNTLRQLDAYPVALRWPRHRQAYFSCFCCPPNVLRCISEIGGYAYALRDDAIYIVLYGQNRLHTQLRDGSAVALTQTSDYPWDGSIRLTIDAAPNRNAAVCLRIPRWCETFSVSLNGTTIAQPTVHEGFVRIERRWKPGDSIELVLDMPAEVVDAHPLVEESLGQLAVRRGPIVYCLESADLPSGVGVLDVSLPPDSDFRLSRVPELANAVALETTLLHRPRERGNSPLYRPVNRTASRTIQSRLVPYFAWDNRGSGEMTVWIPQA
jgi:DUF1680 family protein